MRISVVIRRASSFFYPSRLSAAFGLTKALAKGKVPNSVMPTATINPAIGETRRMSLAMTDEDVDREIELAAKAPVSSS